MYACCCSAILVVTRDGHWNVKVKGRLMEGDRDRDGDGDLVVVAGGACVSPVISLALKYTCSRFEVLVY